MGEKEALITVVYGLVGATGALALVVFAWGFAEYIAKIGLPSSMRDRGISIMEWGVRLIITAIFLILVLKFLERWFA